MAYEEGQGIVIKKSLGKENDRKAGKYYHGESMKEFPLGSRGIVVAASAGYYKVKIGDNVGYFEEGELKVDEKLEKEKQERLNSSLEKALLNPSEVDSVTPQEKSLNPTEIEGSRTLPNTLAKILRYFTNPFYSNDSSVPFEPKFNVREEFAVWMEKEFPRSSASLIRRRKIARRKDEVYKAAIQACEHGVNTTNSCIYSSFSSYLETLKYSRGDFERLYENVETLLKLIKAVSVNVNDTEEKHYGTHVRGRR